MAQNPNQVDNVPTLEIEGYTVEKLLGSGSFGSVFLARKTNEPCTVVAVKELLKGRVKKIKNEFDIQRLLSEKDENYLIVKMLEMRIVDGGFLLFLEYIDGSNLFQVINDERKQTMPKHWYRQLINALKFVHEHDFFHRDVKAENLMITSSDNLKLTDFGKACWYRRKGFEYKLKIVYGTPHYSPPEQFLGERIWGPPSDIWASGVVLLEMLTRRSVWKLPNDKDPVYLMWKNNDITKRQSWREMDENAMKFLRKILLPAPLKRPNINEILEDEWLASDSQKDM